MENSNPKKEENGKPPVNLAAVIRKEKETRIAFARIVKRWLIDMRTAEHDDICEDDWRFMEHLIADVFVRDPNPTMLDVALIKNLILKTAP